MGLSWEDVDALVHKAALLAFRGKKNLETIFPQDRGYFWIPETDEDQGVILLRPNPSPC